MIVVITVISSNIICVIKSVIISCFVFFFFCDFLNLFCSLLSSFKGTVEVESHIKFFAALFSSTFLFCLFRKASSVVFHLFVIIQYLFLYFFPCIFSFQVILKSLPLRTNDWLPFVHSLSTLLSNIFPELHPKYLKDLDQFFSE